jgi:hypothetical protein
MKRRVVRPSVASLLSAALIVAGLLTFESRSDSVRAANDKVGGSTPPAAAARGPEPPFQDWGKPEVVLVLTGGQHAYLEPCGCTENQTGGLARRADLFHQMWGKGWRTVALDAGGDLDPKRLSYEQAPFKLEFFRKALQHMRYKAYALGREELRLGGEKLFELYTQWSAEDEFDLPFLSANVTILSTREIGTPVEFKIIDDKTGGWKFGVTSVIGKSRAREFAESDPTVLKIEDAAAVLPKVIEKMQAKKPDVMILLAHAEDEESRELAAKFPEFKIVATVGGPEDPEVKEKRVGDALYVQVGRKGKHTPCVGVFGTKTKPEFKYELVEMDRHRFVNAPQMVQLMRDYQELLRDLRPDITRVQPAPDKGTYVGVDQCKDCHKKAYDVWINTPHSHALASLTTGRADERPEDVVDRQFDGECLACHVTGWEPQLALPYKGGFIDAKSTPHLANQQCENCHGPGGEHVKLETAFLNTKAETPELLKARAQVQETLDCEQCHDHDNSPKFEEERDAYWEQVKHEGKD